MNEKILLLSAPLQEQITLLEDVIREAADEVLGKEVGELTKELISRAEDQKFSEGSKFAAIERKLENLPAPLMSRVIKVLTLYFHSINKAEQLEIVRVVRQREAQETKEEPHPESLHEAVARLRSLGFSGEGVIEELAHLDVEPTLTAHPTEARRHTVLERQEKIADELLKLRRVQLLPIEKKQLLDDINNNLRILLATDDVRAERLKVLDEVENELYFLSSSIWQVLPGVQRELIYAIEQQFGEKLHPPVFLRYRSWVGGDRDGNPNVTPAITKETLSLLRQKALDLYIAELSALGAELSLSENWVTLPDHLKAALSEGLPQAPNPSTPQKEQRHFEPFRLKIEDMVEKLKRLKNGSVNYKINEFKADLRLLEEALKGSGFAQLAESGRLCDIVVHAEAFGFHLAALDIRQHSSVHAAAVADIFDQCGSISYLKLSEEEKQEVLSRAIKGELALHYKAEKLKEKTGETFALLELIKETLGRFPGSIGSYVISMTHQPSDLLALMLLFKEAGLLHVEGEKVEGALDLVPLIETIEDLDQAESKLNTLLSHPLYRSYLKARGDFQEVMLGYSDSNKDGGYLSANWQLQKAQAAVANACRRAALQFRIFHGRGGSIGRGGGRANRAILSAPPVSRNGRVRFTEQGEVISFRYALHEIAHRHLEQIINAVILSRNLEQQFSPGTAEEHLVERCAKSSMVTYRALIENPAFWEFFTTITPIEHISALPIASRPVARSGGAVTFEDLRAIPWVFAWTQTRYIVPGWFGIGSALSAELEKQPGNLSYLQNLYENWGFFRMVLDNTCQELARARLSIAEHYSALSSKGAIFHESIQKEFNLSAEVVLKITGQRRLLDINPVIQNLIAFRNPATDVLNLLQIELLRRYKKGSREEKETLRPIIFASINAIAAAMQSTG